MKNKLNKAIELLKDARCAKCPSNGHLIYPDDSNDLCEWCIKRNELLAEVENFEDKENDK